MISLVKRGNIAHSALMVASSTDKTKSSDKSTGQAIKIDTTMKQLRDALDQWQSISSNQPVQKALESETTQDNEEWLRRTRHLLNDLADQLVDLKLTD